MLGDGSALPFSSVTFSMLGVRKGGLPPPESAAQTTGAGETTLPDPSLLEVQRDVIAQSSTKPGMLGAASCLCVLVANPHFSSPAMDVSLRQAFSPEQPA